MLKFELSLEMLQVIDQALGNMPYRLAAPVLAELQEQITAQGANDANSLPEERVSE